MSNYFKFASLAHPDKYAYAYDSAQWSSKSETNGYFRMFETYGDGLVQHSNCWSVTFEYLTDYLASLAAALLANPALLAEAPFSFLFRETDIAKIEFAASVVWKESDGDYSKRRYYSRQLQKIGNRSKEHDKRFTEINKWQDGSCASILAIVNGEYASGLEAFINHESIRLWAVGQKKHVPWGKSWSEYFGGDWHKNNALRGAVCACRSIAEAARMREVAESAVDNYKRSLAPVPVVEVS